MRILFAGTPEVAAQSLEALLASEHEVIGVLTRPDARRGRGRTLHPSPVAEVAQAAGVKVYKPKSLRDGELDELLASADLVAVVAYGVLIGERQLALPRHGWINAHFSLLPRWRGAAPVQRALIEGDSHTGVCIFQLEEGLDTGPVYHSERVEIADGENAGELLARLGEVAARALPGVIADIGAGKLVAAAQPERGATYAHMLSPAEGRIDFRAGCSRVIGLVRGFTPNPGAWFMLPGEIRVKVFEVRQHVQPGGQSQALAAGELLITPKKVLVGCGDGEVELVRVAPPGKGQMDGAAWGRGWRGDKRMSVELSK